MNLLDLYEEFFQYVCRLNRMAKTQAHPELATVRSEVKDLLAQVTSKASSDVKALNQVKKLELPMIFFIDNLVCTSRLKFAAQWAEKRLATERNELAGDERFFVDFIEKDLTDTSEEAVERLAIYYVCLGLGFMGMYQNQPEQVRRYIEQIYARIPQFVDRDPRTKISEEAYQHTNTQVLTEPPSNKIILVAVAFVFLCLSVLTICYVTYRKAVHVVEYSTEKIISQAKSQ
jgi:type IV/VI secretion system ImpK/VasF family protein